VSNGFERSKVMGIRCMDARGAPAIPAVLPSPARRDRARRRYGGIYGKGRGAGGAGKRRSGTYFAGAAGVDGTWTLSRKSAVPSGAVKRLAGCRSVLFAPIVIRRC
jgi:hypothetical protein